MDLQYLDGQSGLGGLKRRIGLTGRCCGTSTARALSEFSVEDESLALRTRGFRMEKASTELNHKPNFNISARTLSSQLGLKQQRNFKLLADSVVANISSSR